MLPSNKAAFLLGKNLPLEVRASIYTKPGDHELVVKNAALAINPYDWLIQAAPNLVVSWVKLPFILGTDVAGEVVEVGKNVTNFRVGDRVVGMAAGLDKRANRIAESGFQEYSVLRQNLASPIPDEMSFEIASVIPLGFSTAACALFQKDCLALPFPTTSPKPLGKTLLIWGGSTSVGCNAIQLAVASGCEVITTASPKNHQYLKSLGAAEVFDYNSPTVVRDIIDSFKHREAVGAVAIGKGSYKKCAQVLGGVKGKKFISQLTFDLPPFPRGSLGMVPFFLSLIGAFLADTISAKRNSVTSKMVIGSDLIANEVGAAVYNDFLPGALQQKKFVPAPEPQVVGKGLVSLQNAMDMSKKGVSAKKLVVNL